MHKLLSSALVALFLMTSTASAHKIIMAVYQSGDMIEGELGFSSGNMAVDHLIEVFDENGNTLGETKTDEDGFFTFQPTQATTHVFRADLGAGHIGEATMSAAELASFTGLAKNAAPAPGNQTAPAVTSTAPSVGATVDQAMLAKAIRDELRPLRREIAAYKEKNDLQTILGGIGYIVGIFGFAMYMAARKKLKEATK